MRDSTIDCIIIGYHESPLKDEIDSAMQMRGQSGHLISLFTNTVEAGGERLSYLELLNRVAASETGQDPKLHVSAMPNLGVSYLRNFLYQAKLEVEAINFFDFEAERLKILLAHNHVKTVAITTTFYTNDAPIRDIIKFVRTYSLETKIIVGGPYILSICSYYEKDVLEYSLKIIGGDYYVFDSQGEATLTRLVCALRDGATDMTGIPNLFISGESGFMKTEKLHEENDIEAGRIQWDMLPRDSAIPTVMMRTARSCAFKCSFCTYPVLAGDLAVMGVDAVEQQMLQLRDLGTTHIAFVDDTFNVPLGRFKALCRMMIKNRFSFKWFSYLRCGNIDAEGLDLLAESGCAGVFLGIESGDNQVLLNMNKKAIASKYKDGIIGLRERGVATYASIIVGFPGETVDSCRRTIELLQEAKPTFFHPELYCYYQFAPIGANAAIYDLKGSGYSWSHSTMDWRLAQECLVEMITSITDSTYLPTYSFDFWALPYLLGQGFSLEFVRSFVESCNRLMLKGLGSSAVDSAPEEAELTRLIQQFWPKRSGFSEK